MGHFDGERFVPGSQLADPGAGTPAGVRAREPEPMKRRSLTERAKMLVPAGGRDGEPPPSPFDAIGSKADRRDLQTAAEFVGSMDGDLAEKFSSWLGAEMEQLDEQAGPAEGGQQEHAEKVFLTLDLAEDVKRQAAEGAEAQLEFYGWAMEQFGGRDEFFKWVDLQPDPQEAITELAEEYLEGEIRTP